MKKRIVKKWINRYITPLTKDLPRTQSYATDIRLDDHRMIVASRQHVIANGYIKNPGERTRPVSNVLKAMQRTAELIATIKDEHKHVLLRVKAEFSHNNLYIRIITD